MTLLLAMIAAAVKMKSGHNDWTTVAGKTEGQYACCAGMVAMMTWATSAARAPMAKIHWAARRGMSQAATKAAEVAPRAMGARPKEVERADQWRISCCQATRYQMKVA